MTVVKGVVGRNVHFDGEADIQNLFNRTVNLPQTGNATDLNPARMMEILCQGISINSSAFEGFDEHTKTPGFIGSKTETALLEWMVRMNTPESYKQYREAPWAKTYQIYPFASERKCMATIIKIDPSLRPQEAAGHTKPFYRIFVKGASEIVLKFCDYVAYLPYSPASTMTPLEKTSTGADVKLVKVDSKENYNIQNEIINNYAQESLRTICLAYRDMEEADFEALIAGPMTQAYLEEKREDMVEAARREMVEEMAESGGTVDPNLVEQRLSQQQFIVPSDYTREDLLGSLSGLELLAQQHCTCLAIVGIEDPLRPGVSEAVAQCQQAGVVVRMVTGDNLITAKAIATKCGIYQKGWGFAMEGPKFRSLSIPEMDRILPRLQVLARSSPTDKQILVGRLKALGETVAVTGDGTNDGPALKMADVGFSMGIAGTEVAKEASSIVLMDDNFASIVKAMIWGRAVNDAVKKFLQFQLTVNVTAVALAFISAVADGQEQSVLTAVQLLWVNLIMDTLAALAYATERPTPAVLKRPPEGKSAPLITENMWKMIFAESIFQITVSLVLLFTGPYLFGYTEFAAVGGITANINALTAPPDFPGTTLEYQELLTKQKAELRTVIFNTFVFMQMFNQWK
jgi:Ca2+-transporting ATPase